MVTDCDWSHIERGEIERDCKMQINAQRENLIMTNGTQKNQPDMNQNN